MKIPDANIRRDHSGMIFKALKTKMFGNVWSKNANGKKNMGFGDLRLLDIYGNIYINFSN